MAVAKITALRLLCGILCWLFAGPVYAATIDVTISNLTFQAAAGNNSCSGLPCMETFNITFEYDPTLGINVGPVNVTGTGALSAADIAGPWAAGTATDGLGNYFIDISETGPDYIVIADTDLTTRPSAAPAPGSYPFSDAYMNCFRSSTQCESDFVHNDMTGAHMPGAAICGTVTVGAVDGTGGGSCTTSTTPLPAALPLFATSLGLTGLLWRRRRKLKFADRTGSTGNEFLRRRV
jgi:hypothetical protein